MLAPCALPVDGIEAGGGANLADDIGGDGALLRPDERRAGAGDGGRPNNADGVQAGDGRAGGEGDGGHVEAGREGRHQSQQRQPRRAGLLARPEARLPCSQQPPAAGMAFVRVSKRVYRRKMSTLQNQMRK